MSDLIAERAMAAMAVAADNNLARRIRRLHTAVTVLALLLGLSLVALLVVVWPALPQSNTETALQPKLQMTRVAVKEDTGILAYVRMDVENVTKPQPLTYYFLFPENSDVEGKKVTVSTDTYKALPAVGSGSFAGSSGAVLSLQNTCKIDQQGRCADLVWTPMSGAVRFAIGTEDLHILAMVDIPTKTKTCTELLGEICQVD